MKLSHSLIVLLITAVITVIGNFDGYGVSILEAIPGILILVAIAFAGIILNKVIPINIPSVAYIVTISTILTILGVPGAEKIAYYASKVNFLALFVMIGTYVCSALIAEVILKQLG